MQIDLIRIIDHLLPLTLTFTGIMAHNGIHGTDRLDTVGSHDGLDRANGHQVTETPFLADLYTKELTWVTHISHLAESTDADF